MSRLFNKYYDWLMGPLEKRTFRTFRKQLLSEAEGVVLEIGSGTGINFEFYDQAHHVTAIEPEPSMLEKSLARAKQASVPIEVVHAGAEQLPYPSNSFDTVVGTLVFCTIPDPLAALLEARRVCKDDGKLLLFEHIKMYHPVWGAWQEWLKKRLCGGCHLNRDTLALVNQAGFHISRIEWKYNKLLMILVAEKS